MNKTTTTTILRHLTALGAAGLVAASSPARADSSVKLYGLVDVMAARIDGAVSGVKSTDKPVNRIDSGGFSTSFFGIGGIEDLGGGTEASFALEAFMRPDTGEATRSGPTGPPLNLTADPFWSRTSWVGLGNVTLGRIRLGNDATPMWIAALTSNALGDSTIFSPLLLVGFIGSPWTGGTSWTNGVFYDSPTVANFQARLAASLSEGQGGRNYGGYLRYGNGPFRASVSYQSVKKNPVTFADGTSPNNTTSWLLAASYDFGIVNVWTHYGRIQNNGTETTPLDQSHRLWDLSAAVPVGGVGRILLAYAQRTTGSAIGPVPATAIAGNTGRRIATIGYDYNLSKRTDLYIVGMRDRTVTNNLNPPGPPVLVTASGNNYGIGIRHRF